MPAIALTRDQRHERILKAGSLATLLNQPDGEAILRAEAEDKALDDHDRLITAPALDHLLLLRANHRRARASLGFLGTDDVIIIPGFMGSALRDVAGPHGLIWIDPKLFLSSEQIAALQLAKFNSKVPDHELDPLVRIESTGAVPAIYDVMWADLNFRQYDVEIFPFDWRKDLERPASLLADRIRGRIGRKARPLHLIAHSQGALVARRAIQMLGADQARKLVNNLVLLGPATFGTFSAAFALAGSHPSIATVQKFGVKLPQGIAAVFQSFTGLYQLLPWNPALFQNGFDPARFKNPAFWQTGVDKNRLNYGLRWGERIDTSFFHDRTSIILGDQPTVGAVKFVNNVLVADGPMVPGDGTVPDSLSRIERVQRTYRARGVDHMTMPMHLSVMAAVRSILRGDAPALERQQPALGVGKLAGLPVPILKEPASKRAVARPIAAKGAAADALPLSTPAAAVAAPPILREPPTPPFRRLWVFSFDPLLGTKLDTLEIARIRIEVPWEPTERLQEGPVGEYIEVVDYDPATGCFYAPVDLTSAKLAAQDGLPPSESDPQFHQQMTYAVAMATIATFERALGRAALWAPRLIRDDDGEVIKTPVESQYLPRLRIYPHALREANAYYDPDRHALLFGYFPSRQQPGGDTLPGGTVFACQSFDIIAHETTHALLHGLHRYYLDASNPDVLAFHEAFADAVALFQHFSHPQVVAEQVARTRGDLKKENLLGQLAQQFGQAMGAQRAALRQYVTVEPSPALYSKTNDAHDRGAILVAALFRAFQNIYERRSKDLYRIAADRGNDSPNRELHPALVDRLAVEAAKSARHLLTMCIRALDYVPPVDLTFGEYIRALITADFDLVSHDDRGYRVAVIDAFRSWGIYPADVNVLDEPALLWNTPDDSARDALLEAVSGLDLSHWKLRADRRSTFLSMDENAMKIREWLFKNANKIKDDGRSLGVKIFGTSCQSIPRNDRNRPLPKFEINSVRPCLRLGPDGEQRIDIVAEIVQRRAGFYDPKIQEQVDAATAPWAFTRAEREAKKRPLLPTPEHRPDFWFRGGCTLLIDRDSGEIRYSITKSVRDDARLERQRAFEQSRDAASASTAAIYYDVRHRNPFALLHAHDHEPGTG